MTQKLVQIHVSILNLENVIGWQLFSLIQFTLPCVLTNSYVQQAIWLI